MVAASDLLYLRSPIIITASDVFDFSKILGTLVQRAHSTDTRMIRRHYTCIDPKMYLITGVYLR